MFLIRFKRCAAFAWIVLISGALVTLFSSRVCLADGTGKALASPPALSGTVKDALGRPIAGVRVRLQAAGRVVARTHTDSTGAFQFKTIAPGTYTISVNKQGFKPTVETIAVSEGKRHEPMVLAMEATAPLTLKVITEAAEQGAQRSGAGNRCDGVSVRSGGDSQAARGTEHESRAGARCRRRA